MTTDTAGLPDAGAQGPVTDILRAEHISKSFGAVVLAILLDGLPIIGVSADPVNIVFGVIVLVAMVANVWLTRVRERGTR